MALNEEIFDGFDAYGVDGFVAVLGGVSDPDSSLIGGKWTSLWADPGSSVDYATCTVVPALSGRGYGLKVQNDLLAGAIGISKTLGANHVRIAGTVTFQSPLFNQGIVGIVFGDAGVDQLAITIEPSGQIGFRLSTAPSEQGILGELKALSAESVTALTTNVLSWDVTFDDTSGSVEVWLNGKATSLSSGGVTDYTGGNSANQIRIVAQGCGSIGGGNLHNYILVDHLHIRGYGAGGGGGPLLDNPVVETDFADADVSTDFAFGAAVLGADYTATETTNSPGANQLILRSWTPDVGGTLQDVCILPNSSSAGGKFKPAVYSDNAGAPDALLSSGPEVVGCAADTRLTLALTSPVTLVAGTPVWLGYVADVSVQLHLVDEASTPGRKIARTYGSGAPGTAGAMTINQPGWVIYGSVTGVVSDWWSLLDNNPNSGDRSYVTSATPGDADLFTFPPLSSTPVTIHGVSLDVLIKRTDAGARTIDLQLVSAAVTSAGDRPGQTPAGDYGYLTSYYFVDPDTSAAWNASGVNLIYGGYKIAT